MNSASRLINQLLNEQDEKRDNIDDLSIYGIRELRDGLTIEKIEKKYSWLLRARMKDAVIGESRGRLVWYNGIWEKGYWNGGTWKSGYWISGTWYNGIWEYGSWSSGTWISGTWHRGHWIEGYDRNGERHFESPDKW